jgi:ATP-binding cassette subfamily B protein
MAEETRDRTPAGPRHQFRHYVRRRRSRLVSAALLTAAAGLVATLPPFFLGQIVDELQKLVSLGEVARLSGLVVLTAGARAVLQAVARYLTVGSGRDIEYDMRGDLFAHLQRLHLGYFQHQRIGDLMARLTNDLNAVRMMVSGGFLNLTGSVTTVLFAAAAMISLSLRLTVVAFAVVPLMALAFTLVGRQVQGRFRGLQAQFGQLSTGVQENLSGIRVVKAFGQEQAEIKAFREQNEEYVDRALGLAKVEGSLWPITEGLLGIAVLAVLIVGSQDAIHGELTLGQLVQFVAYFNLMSAPLLGLGWTLTLFQSGVASLGRLSELFAARPRIADPQHPVDHVVLGEVELRNVGLTLDGRRVLDGIDIRIPAGGRLGVVGATGAGKSSLVNLIPRLLDPDRGQVLVDGIDVRAYPLDVLRRAIGVVPQETFLFSASLRDNLGLGSDVALTDEQVAWVARVSQLEGDVADFPAGFDTMIGERGVTLSGGQRQRAAIARAIAKDPRILILDDSLSAVDTHTEAEILRELRAVAERRTTIVVAHRVSSVMDADEIVVLEAGRIVERGQHEDLIRRRGPYARMFRRQMLHAEAEEAEGGDTADDVIASSSQLIAEGGA